MKKAKRDPKARPATLAMRLADAEDRVQLAMDTSRAMSQQVDVHNREEGRLANENTRLARIIEGLKEELFNKSLALAHAEGKLERVDHEDAERAEVVVVDELRLTRRDPLNGMEISCEPMPVQHTMLKYELAKSSQPMRMASVGDPFAPYDDTVRRDQYGGRPTTERPKHWVNRH